MISIIIPIYNSEQTLSKCLDSVLASTYKNIEVLLLDDGSKDNSLSICRKYAEKDSRVRVFHHDNHGVSYTRNRGLDEATGDYIMFVDSDDTISPTWVEAYAEAAEKNQSPIIIGALTKMQLNGETEIRKLPSTGVFESTDIWKLISQDCFDAFGYVANKLYCFAIINNNHIRFNEKMTVQEDLDFFISYLEVVENVCIIAESGYYYEYEDNKREVSLLDLLNNKMRVFNHIEKYENIDDYDLTTLAEDVFGNVYHILRQSKTKFTFKLICSELQKHSLERCLVYIKKTNEKSIVFKYFCHNKFNLIWFYFLIRCIPERIRIHSK